MVPDGKSTQRIYQIQVQGELDPGWEIYFDGLAITLDCTCADSPVTTLVGPVTDQAALRGLLCKLWDLNLALIAVQRIDPDEGKRDLPAT